MVLGVQFQVTGDGETNAVPAERQESQPALVGVCSQGCWLPYIFVAKASIQDDLQTLPEALGQPEKKQDRGIAAEPSHTPYTIGASDGPCVTPQIHSVKATSWP